MHLCLHRSVRSYACLCLLSVSQSWDPKAKGRRWSLRLRKRRNLASYLQHRRRRRQKDRAVWQLQLDDDRLELREKAWTKTVKELFESGGIYFCSLGFHTIYFNWCIRWRINLTFPPIDVCVLCIGIGRYHRGNLDLESLLTLLYICWEDVFDWESDFTTIIEDWDGGDSSYAIHHLHQQMIYLTLNWYYHT